MNNEISSLEDIRIIRNDNSEENRDNPHKDTLEMKISTWMMLYANLETSEYRAKMRDVCISIAEALRKENIIVADHGSFSSKFASSSPYHYFLTLINVLQDTHSQIFSVSFHEIIDYTLGEIVDSLHLCNDVELSWIVTEYMLAAQDPKMTIICDACVDFQIEYELPFDIILTVMEGSSYRFHNSKVSILKYYNDKIRIIVSNADMRHIQWKSQTQGIWVSPLLPLLPDITDPSDGESITNFKNDFIDYLSQYEQPEVFGWIALVQRADCSAINVAFIASVPGYHDNLSLNKWGYNKLETVLANHVTTSPNSQNWPIIAHSSCLGVYGNNYDYWLANIVKAMSNEKNSSDIKPDIKIIYPSQKNVNESIYDKSNTKLFHCKDTYLQELWMSDYMYQWKSEKTCRSLAMPQLRCYTRISPDETEISWFLLTSCNLTKSSWGKLLDNERGLKISNYEAGVLFLPKIVIKQTSFPIKETNSLEIPVFLLPYDVPLTKYEPDDNPFFTSDPNFVVSTESIRKRINTESNDIKDFFTQFLSK
ncbi:PREDICTED: probable tyrosyl-DNA phosphodiesterase [Ceratosolen solmsi marchali]|uniref:Probable tyrosyl-DNA phosphodiesterase n=1 Tax=Ceratosolen solmsi marchali TaxID=326594 RepID=A0AAJ6YBC6_9HYME|nr:PREDICTED: probable tyrosyl-DNA phosphodiesterase [Ceratosolen solmsi marchali]